MITLGNRTPIMLVKFSCLGLLSNFISSAIHKTMSLNKCSLCLVTLTDFDWVVRSLMVLEFYRVSKKKFKAFEGLWNKKCDRYSKLKF